MLVFNRLVAFALACLPSLAFTSVVHAQQNVTVCFNGSVPLQNTNWTSSVTIPKFNPALGTLQQVTFRLDSHVEGFARVESLDSSPTTIQTFYAAQITLQRPDTSVIVTGLPNVSFSDPVAPYDGTTDFAGPSGVSHNGLSLNSTDNHVSPPPVSDLALFTGLGSITLPVVAQGQSTAIGSGNVITQFMTRAAAAVQVCYVYTPCACTSAPVFSGCTPGTVKLGCNPATIPGCSTSVTASDNCEPIPVTCTITNSSNGCNRTRLVTYSATNACGTSTCVRTYTWTEDTTPPTFDNCVNGNTDLGCNPAVLPACRAGVTASDNCGPAGVDCTFSDAVSGCVTTRTFVYTARDQCNNTAACTRTFTWTVDTTPPTFTNCVPGNTDLGCNPPVLPTCSTNVTALDNCGPATVTCASSDAVSGCITTRTFVYTARDLCNNTTLCTRTFTWKVDTTPPTFTNCVPGNTPLGCNPTVLPSCSTNITATDNCGPATVTCASSDAVSGCLTTRTFVYTATDACNNTAACTRTFTWTVDTTPPTFTNCVDGNTNLGCNPTALPSCSTAILAIDNCGPATVTCASSDAVNGCVTTRTHVYTATDACNNTATCTRTFTWTVDTTPPTFDNCVTGNTPLGCNPTVLPSCSTNITATDNCGPATVTCASSDAVSGCLTTRTFVYTATDACSNTAACTRTFTWTVDTTPPTFDNCVDGNTSLGCNPTVLPTCSTSITAGDNCGPATVTCASSDTVDGCLTTRSLVYTARDACNNTATCTRTFTWTVDTTPPTFTNCVDGNTDLGCNPAALPSCSTAILAIDNCGPATVTCASSDAVNGCATTRTLVYTARDGCNNSATCTRTFTWTVDTTPPTFDNCTGGNTNLGCNPTVLPTCSTSITASDNCGPATVTCASSDAVNGCVTTRTFVYTARDACNNSAACTRTFTWTVDTTPPTFSNCVDGNTDLGCNPTVLPSCSTNITAVDNCGPATVTCASSDAVNGCVTTRTFVYTATDACNNTSACTRTFTWTVDTTPPTFTNCAPGTTDLGCNPTVLPTCSASISATDNCGPATVTCASADAVNGCITTRTFVYTATDACNNTAACTRTFTWTVDTTPPTFTNCTPGNNDQGCNPLTLPTCNPNITAVDNCGPATVTCTSSDAVTGCSTVRTFVYTATDACNNTATCTRTATWKIDTTPPTFTNCTPGDTDLGCNPAVLPTCSTSITAIDNCGPATVTCASSDAVNGCVTTRTFVYTARDACNNTSTCTRTFTWKVDITSPTFDSCVNGLTDLGCNPTVLPTCDTGVTATDNCGPATVTCSSSDSVTGCVTTRTILYIATDSCTNTTRCTRQFSWTVDTTPPTFDNCTPGNTDLGCNPTVLPTCSTTITAGDNCGPATVTCASSDAVSGCTTTRTFVYTARDGCNNTAACTKTFTWKVDTTPPTFTNCTPGNTDLGCNPTVLPTCSTTITATDTCGPATVTCASSDAVNGCTTTRTFVYTATDACNNTAACTKTFTWKVDTTPPTFTNCTPGNTDLGCNPTVLPTCSTSITATDTCGPATVTCASSDSVSGCTTTRTLVYTATDACNNTATCTKTFTWKVDTTPPTFTNCTPGNTNLGCNPATLPTCSTTITATDTCGPATVTCASSDAVSGCTTTRTFVYTATDACNNTATCTKTFTWKVDTTPPTFTNCTPGNTDLGCSPATLPTCSTTIKATDNCGTASVTCASSDAVSGCTTTRTFVYTATDLCNNTATCTKTFTWKVDTTPPTFTNCTPGNTDLGCNPVTLPTCSTTITATDNCGTPTVTCASSDSVSGCTTTRTFVYTARDACNNTTKCTKTFTWKVDTTPPTFTNCTPGNTDLGCNPTVLPRCSTSITATDNCGGTPTVTCASSDSVSGCTTTRTFVYTARDACNNTSTCTKTFTWKIDTTPPTFTNCTPGNTDLGCNPATLPTCSTTITATDNCGGTPTVTCTFSDSNNGCNRTRTFVYTARDACNNTTKCTKTFTWKIDTTPPTFTNCTTGTTNLGNNPSSIPTCDSNIRATDTCSSPTVTCTFSDTQNGCNHTRTIVYTARDGCNNTTTCTKTYNWTTSSGICVTKYYDANANGIRDSGEPGISRWKFRLNTGATVITNSAGEACFTGLANGTYTVTELTPTQTNWVATTPLTCQVTLSSTNCSASCTFGNYCWETTDNGKTISYWTGSNGKRLLEQNDTEWRDIVNALNLRNADGTAFNVSTSASFTTAYNAFSAWIGAATQTNMAYKLSATMASTALAIAYNALDHELGVIVPGGQKTASNVCVVPFLSTTQSITCGSPPLLTLTTVNGSTSCGCTSKDGTASIYALLERADCLLGTYNLTTSASTARTYQEALEDILDSINNDGNNGYACGGLDKYIHPDEDDCDINFP